MAATVPAADTDPAARKRLLRRELLARRRALPPADLAAASAAIVTALRALPELTGADRVLLHVALAHEPDLDALLTAPPPGVTLLLPRVAGDGLEAVVWRPGLPLRGSPLGVAEPTGPAAPLASLDVAVVPGVAFTADGARLGRGGGHYDRLLAALRPDARSVGVTVEALLVPALPTEAHDRAVDVVVTDASVRRRSGPGPGRPA